MNRLASILVFAFCLAVFSCKPKPTPPTPPVSVNLMTVAARPVVYYDKYPSTTVAISQVSLTAQVTGYITSIDFTEGSHVHKGQLLYRLDMRLYEASVDQARATLRVDSGNLRLVQQDYDRYQYLAKYKAIATQLVDHASIQLQNAKDSVVAAPQQLKTALTNPSYANIYAPFDGTIGISGEDRQPGECGNHRAQYHFHGQSHGGRFSRERGTAAAFRGAAGRQGKRDRLALYHFATRRTALPASG